MNLNYTSWLVCSFLVVNTSLVSAMPTVGLGWDRSPHSALVGQHTARAKDVVGLEAFSWWLAEDWHSPREDLAVLTEVRYARRTLKGGGTFSRVAHIPSRLYSLELAVTLTGALLGAGETVLTLAPVLENASEFTLKAEDFKLNLGLLQRWPVGRWQFGLGVAWTRLFGRELVIPVAEVAWCRQEEGLSASVLVPLAAELAWSVREQISFSLVARVSGSEYRTEEEDTELDEWVRYGSATAGPELTVHVSSLTTISTRAGWSWWRHLDRIAPTGDRHGRTWKAAPAWQISVNFGKLEAVRAFPVLSGWR